MQESKESLHEIGHMHMMSMASVQNRGRGEQAGRGEGRNVKGPDITGSVLTLNTEGFKKRNNLSSFALESFCGSSMDNGAREWVESGGRSQVKRK